MIRDLPTAYWWKFDPRHGRLRRRYPVTGIGRVIAVIVMVYGGGLVAVLPVAHELDYRKVWWQGGAGDALRNRLTWAIFARKFLSCAPCWLVVCAVRSPRLRSCVRS